MTSTPQPQGPVTDLALHTLGWKAFQDLCAQVCAETLKVTVSVYREAQDGGQDAVFLLQTSSGSTEATVQCKFSSKSGARLRVSDVNSELSTVAELVKSGKATTYYFITSLGVDAPVAALISQKLTSVGVVDAHILGREWLTLQIRSSAKLRALVPRVYGLGDLSTILDERSALQTKALLGHLRSSLRVYVPTQAHRNAVNILAKHKVVLLLGAPATGKSMLAAILATTAMDGESHECIKCEGPIELMSRWNPNESNRLYWVDDAFGPNQLRSDFVDAWINNMPKVKVAVELGNRLILTSRSHLWFSAKASLGTRNLPVLADKTAVVDLGELRSEEREQIIYNHIKARNQSAHWKSMIKSHLPQLAKNVRLLPEIARRLGDKSFTKTLALTPSALDKFVAEPADFLVQTIKELSKAHQAAMTLVFFFQGKLPAHKLTGNSTDLVAAKYGVSAREITDALQHLDQSFLSFRQAEQHHIWGFIHPTFIDAMIGLLSERPDLVEIYVQGAKIETLLTDTICEGAAPIRDAVTIPRPLFEILVQRLLEACSDPSLDLSLIEFLCLRATDQVVKAVLDGNSSIVPRTAIKIQNVWSNLPIRFFVLAYRLERLPEDVREEVESKLMDRAIKSLDVSFFDVEGVFELFDPPSLIRLGVRLSDIVNNLAPSRIEEIAEQADPNYDIPDQFIDIRRFVDQLYDFFSDNESMQNVLSQLTEQIDDSENDLAERKQPDEDEEGWFKVSPAKITETQLYGSAFSDVDE